MAEGSPPWGSKDTLSRHCFAVVSRTFVVGRIKKFGRKLPCLLLLFFCLFFIVVVVLFFFRSIIKPREKERGRQVNFLLP